MAVLTSKQDVRVEELFNDRGTVTVWAGICQIQSAIVFAGAEAVEITPLPFVVRLMSSSPITRRESID
jgi:hypothetical protein